MSDTTPGSEPTPDPTPGSTPDPAPQPDPHPTAQQPVTPPAPPTGSSSTGSPSAPSQGGWSSSTAQQQANEAVATLKKGNPLDLATVGAGLLVFLASLLPYYTVSVDGFGSTASSSANAWHGFFGWFGALLALAAAVVLVLHLLGRALPVPVPLRMLVLSLFAAAAVSTLLALFVFPGGGCDDSLFGGSICDIVDQGHGIGYWLALLASVAGTALAALRRTAP